MSNLKKIFVYLILLLLIANPIYFSNNTFAQSQYDRYEEELSIVLAGDLIYWSITLFDVNTTGFLSDDLKNFDGIESFSLIQYSQQGPSDPRFQMFQSNGYAVFDSLLPNDGVFVEINAKSESTANRFTSLLSTDLKLGLFPFDNKDKKLIFYSHAESDLIFEPIWMIFQNNDDGFNTLIEPDIFKENQAPIVSLSGESINGEMIYSVSLIGINERGLIDNTPDDNSVLGMELIPSRIFSSDFINSSSTSVNSVISIQTYGSFIDSKNRVTKSIFLNGDKENDNAIITHNFTEYGSKISYTLSPESSFNQSLPLIYYPPVLSVIRDIENGSVNTGDAIESRITFTNLSPEIEGLVIDKITFKDNWWSDHFELLEGGGNETIENLRPGESVTVSKLLSVTSDDSVKLTSNYENIIFDYSFTIDDVQVSSQTRSNEFSLILNDVGPSLIAISTQNKSYYPMRNVVTADLELRNIGTRSAYSVSISLNDTLVKEFDSIPSDLNNIIKVSTNISNSDLLINRQNFVWDIIWTELDEEKCVYSNQFTITDEYNAQVNAERVSFDVPDLTIEKNSPIPLDGIWKDALEVEIKITNNGNMNLTNIDILDTLPLNVDLHTSSDFVNSPIASSSGKYITAIIPILTSKNSTTLRYNLTYDVSENVILPPAKIIVTSNNDDFTFLSKSSVLPIAVHLSKTIDITEALTGYNFTMFIEFENRGDLMLHNVGVKGNDDEYIVIEGDDWDERSTLYSGDIMKNEYIISSPDESVDRNLLQARGEFLLAGQTVRIFTEQIPILIIKSPVITIDIPENIFDNQEVDLVITLSNPSNFTINSIVISPDVLDNMIILNDDEIFSTIQSLGKGDSIELTSKVLGISPGKELQFKPIVEHLHLGQTISVPIDELSVFVSEELRNRYLPSLGLALASMFVLLYFSNKLVIRKD